MELYHGDCLEIMKSIPDGSVDMILCDLPYGITSGNKWDVVIPFPNLWEQYNRIIKSNGAIVLFGSEPFSSMLRLSNLKNFKYDWVWYKNTVTGIANAARMPMKAHELLSVFYSKQPTYNRQPTKRASDEAIQRAKYKINGYGSKNLMNKGMNSVAPVQYESENCNPRSVLEFNTPPNAKGRLHPTQKPVPLLEYLIRTYTNEGETVLDNCMGSGSTGVAALNTGRKFIGIELDAKYFEIAQKRIVEAGQNLFNCM